MAERKPGKPSVSNSEAERTRAALKRLYSEKFNENATELARAIGRTQPAVTLLLDGTNKPSLQTCRAIAKASGLPENAFLDDYANDVPPGEPFPSKYDAAHAARRLRLPEWAIERMLKEPPPPGLTSDPDPVFWYRRIEQLLSGPRPSPDDGGKSPNRKVARGKRRPSTGPPSGS